MNDYPFVCPIQVRWRDLDAFQHVNNSVFVTYLEVARATLWNERFGGSEAGDIPFVIARLEIDYKRPIRLYDTVEVGLRAGEVAGASFDFEYRVEAAGSLVAQARTARCA
jgi:acyl-CoA thioester hydrolase